MSGFIQITARTIFGGELIHCIRLQFTLAKIATWKLFFPRDGLVPLTRQTCPQ